jgi:glycosyltransferase involved in cell wall biosynthesis
VLEKVPDAQFLHAGDGELRDAVLAEAERLGISGNFRLLGWRRDVREIIHLSDVLVLTSLWEGLPRVFPQAMAAGKPIVATAVDGAPEAVKDGVNGFLSKPHDVEYMAEKVALLLMDRPLAAGMGEAGRSMVHEFDEAESLVRVEALYDTLIRR